MLIYSLSLAATIALELFVARIWLAIRRDNGAVSDVLVAVTAINLISHPLAWAAFNSGQVDWWLVELMIVLFEACALCWLPARRRIWAFGLSLAMNLVSMSAGITLSMMMMDRF